MNNMQKELYEEFLGHWNDDNDYVEVMTSGSTGTPKVIRLKKGYMEASARRTLDFFDLRPGSRLHSCMSLEYIGGKMMIVRSIVGDCTFSYETPSLEALKDVKGDIDLISVVPAQMDYILSNLDTLPKVRHILIGGAPVGTTLRRRIIESGVDAWESYAMTETATHIAMRRVAEDENGNPLPFTPLKGAKISQYEDGCIVIEDMGQEKLKTNDIIEFTADGDFYVIGRKDDIINTGGKKVHPQTIENILGHFMPDDINYCISSTKDEKWGERITLIIQKPSHSDSLISTTDDAEIKLIDRISNIINGIPEERLARWCRPKDIRMVNSFPTTKSGKPSRRELKKLIN